LTDLTTDSTWTNSTIPGAAWDQVLGSKPNTNYLIPVFYQLREFQRDYGSKEIQRRWMRIWVKYKDRIYWDSRERCFKLRASAGASNNRVHATLVGAFCLSLSQ